MVFYMVFEARVSYSDYSHKVLAHCMCPSYYIKNLFKKRDVWLFNCLLFLLTFPSKEFKKIIIKYNVKYTSLNCF